MATNHLSLLQQQQQQQLYYHPQTWCWNLKDYRCLGEREHLFEKLLTPSDVGKLNRLVIPKQHAEKYFPLDSESGDKGLILSFEDECGKAWSFRYSYWTSSQSYVLTKGWSRYVKDKRLDAGDVVLFERRRSDAGRLYIGWRRKGEASTAAAIGVQNQMPLQCNPAACEAQPLFLPRTCAVQPECVPSCGDTAVPSPHAATSNSKKLRLFGVNMEYGLVPGSPSSDDQQPRELQFLPCYTDLNSQLSISRN